ncbi:Hint domain-containing protein [Rhodobacteraceae bacterium NNCM2]|nr:Hint domain-containing protein [Coraliihabitans acroporae]
MNMFFLSGFALSDFSFEQANGTPFTISPNENGPFPLPGGSGATATLDANAEAISIIVSDDDANHQDAFLETGGLATLQDPDPSDSVTGITIAGTFIPYGTVVEPEFAFTTDTGEQFIFVSLGGSSGNNGSLHLVLSTAEITPGQTLTFTSSADGPNIPYSSIVCFTRGTEIETPGGRRPIEGLSVGDEVLRSDGQPITIRWIGSRKLDKATLAMRPGLRPICISAGALGENLPERDLMVSPQHRMLVRNWRAELMFGEPEVLVSAKALVNDHDIRPVSDGDEVEYFHMLFDQHEIILAEGAETESFHPGDAAWTALEQAARDEIVELFPQLETEGLAGLGPTARPVLRSFEMAALVSAMR